MFVYELPIEDTVEIVSKILHLVLTYLLYKIQQKLF
nr:MAG TPA: hypothetical protein [Crassvirales sp.]